MGARPLAGRGVLVTRPAHQAAGLAAAIEARGGRALRLPTVAIAPPRDPQAARQTLHGLAEVDLLIFISPNAVEHALPFIDEGGGVPAGVALAAVGAATAQRLKAAGLHATVVPSAGADSEALLAHPALARVAGWRVVICRGEGGREMLAGTLRQRGAAVRYAEVYRRACPVAGGDDLRRWLAAGELALLTATSGNGLENLLAIAGAETADRLRSLPLVVVSERMLQLARSLGFAGPVTVAAGAGDAAMVDALERLAV